MSNIFSSIINLHLIDEKTYNSVKLNQVLRRSTAFNLRFVYPHLRHARGLDPRCVAEHFMHIHFLRRRASATL
jgi:hypothetical protein